MRLVKLTKQSSELPKLKELYYSAFPKEERAPWNMMRRKIEYNNIDFFALYDETTCVGMAYNIKNDKFAYLFYLAIFPEMRGKGYGTQAVQSLIQYYSDKTLFLALERLDSTAENYQQRLKRHQFYLNAGLQEMENHIKEGKVIYDIMGTGVKLSNKEYQNLMLSFTNRLFTKLVDLKVIETLKI